MNGAASKPPLPHRPPGSSRNLKQREREVPHVDWERSLQHFAACISADLDALHRSFVEQDAISFAAWKRLWTDAKMSAAFHVEFWESSPTNTHKTVLQQALDGLVWCIEERDGEFDNAAGVAALIGRVFAMYCAYSVQLGSPKHKIDVDPQAWTALLTINCVMCGVGAALFPSAAREVRAMMQRLVAQENAFLRCLQGFGPSVRLQERAPRSQGEDARQDSLLASSSRPEEAAPVKQSKVDQVKALNDRYQELMSRTRAADLSVPCSSARLGGRRTQAAVSASLMSSVPSPGTGTDGQELAHALATFMEYKANEDVRRIDRVARAAAAREYESRSMVETNKSERDAESNIEDLSDRDSVISVPTSPIAGSVASRRSESRRRSDSGGSDAFLAELESELHADISSDQVEPATTRTPQRAPTEHRDKQSPAFSEISEVDSDALVNLERKLGQSVRVAPSRPTTRGQTKVSPPVQCKRGRNPPTTAETASRTAQASTHKPVDTSKMEKPRPAAKQARSDSVASRVSFTESWATSSVADSDGLAEIQAELDSIPSLAAPDSVPVEALIMSQTFEPRRSSSKRPTAKPKAKQSTRQAASRKRKSAPDVVERASHKHQARIPVQHKESRPRALSVVSNSSELMQAELDFSAAPVAKTTPSTASVRTSIQAVQPRLRRSSRLSSVVSEADSNALEELEKELQATAAILVPVQPQPEPIKPLRKRGAVSSKGSVQRTTTARSNVKKARLNRGGSPVVTTVHRPPAEQTSSNTNDKQQVATPNSIARESSRISPVSSDTESDSLAELVAELEAPVTAETSTAVQGKWNVPSKKASTRPAARRKLPASSTVDTPHLAWIHTKAPSRVAVPAVVRRSARLSSLASDTESDGLEDLMAELDTAPASATASKPLVVSTKKPRARVVTAKPQSTRSQGTKTKAKAKPKQVTKSTKTKVPASSATSRATRTPRTAQRTQSTTNRSTSATKPPARQTPVAPVQLSSSVAFDSDSDGLAELEAELQAGPS